VTRILVVDNYDSFVFTIVGYLQQLGAECEVVRNDAVPASAGADYDGVLVSPGPGTPERPRDFGICADVLARYKHEVNGPLDFRGTGVSRFECSPRHGHRDD